MITIILIWTLFWFAVSTLAIIQVFDDSGCNDMEEICCSTALSIFLVLIWPITIWVALVKWYHDGCSPAWVDALCELYNLIKRKDK